MRAGSTSLLKLAGNNKPKEAVRKYRLLCSFGRMNGLQEASDRIVLKDWAYGRDYGLRETSAENREQASITALHSPNAHFKE